MAFKRAKDEEGLFWTVTYAKLLRWAGVVYDLIVPNHKLKVSFRRDDVSDLFLTSDSRLSGAPCWCGWSQLNPKVV